jgi:hypothetical protein
MGCVNAGEDVRRVNIETQDQLKVIMQSAF